MKFTAALCLLSVSFLASANGEEARKLKRSGGGQKAKTPGVKGDAHTCVTKTYYSDMTAESVALVSNRGPYTDPSTCIMIDSSPPMGTDDEFDTACVAAVAVVVAAGLGLAVINAIAAANAVAAANWVAVSNWVAFWRNEEEDVELCQGDTYIIKPTMIYVDEDLTIPGGMITYESTFIDGDTAFEQVLISGELFYDDGSEISFTGYSGNANDAEVVVTGGTKDFIGVTGDIGITGGGGGAFSVKTTLCG